MITLSVKEWLLRNTFFILVLVILSTQGGSPEAGKERKRQQDLENNYNLVWSEDDLQTVPREDDDTDGEVEVESF